MEEFKLDISDNNVEKIDDYGIYRYFYENDFKSKKKLISAVVGDNFIINTKDAYRSDHYGMIIDINERYGKFDFYMASSGDELNFFADNKLNSTKINVMLNSLKELRKYCNEFNKEKNIDFIGNGFDDELKNSDNIDNIIEILERKTSLDDMLDDKVEIDLSIFDDKINFI